MAPPVTPDGRYIVVRGRLWRATRPDLTKDEAARLRRELMAARRGVREALAGRADLSAARAAVQSAKVALGERGPVWWTDGSPDFNRHMARNAAYAEWWAGLTADSETRPRTH